MSDMREENQVEDYYKMYLAIFPMMIKKQIEFQTFEEFLLKNNPKKNENKVNMEITNKSDKEILEEIGKFDFIE